MDTQNVIQGSNKSLALEYASVISTTSRLFYSRERNENTFRAIFARAARNRWIMPSASVKKSPL
jgi:hypothetical protein